MQIIESKSFAVRASNQDLLQLYESQDAEVRPGLFEGDIAVTSEVHALLFPFCISCNAFHIICCAVFRPLAHRFTLGRFPGQTVGK